MSTIFDLDMSCCGSHGSVVYFKPLPHFSGLHCNDAAYMNTQPQRHNESNGGCNSKQLYSLSHRVEVFFVNFWFVQFCYVEFCFIESLWS